MVELENVALYVRCLSTALFILVTMYVNLNSSEASLSSEKDHPDSARILINKLPRLHEKVLKSVKNMYLQ